MVSNVSMSPAKSRLAAAGLIFILAAAAYSNSFHAGFQFDDFHQFVKNQNVRELRNIPKFFADADMGSFLNVRGYRPLTYSSFAINYAISRYDVWSYHAFNLLLHIINSVLVFILLMTALEETRRENAYTVSLSAALVFALHPIQTQAVTYISGRSALLACLFYLAGFISFLRFRKGNGGPVVKALLCSAAPVFYLLGMLSKENAATLPAVMLIYDLIFTVPKRGGLVKARMLWLYYLPFIAALAGFLALRKALAGFAAGPDTPISAGVYLMSQAGVILLYLRLLFLPINQNADYSLPFASSLNTLVLITAVLVLALLALLYKVRRKEPALAFFGFWFFITLAPESTIFPLEDIAFEHRLYLPSVGFFAAATVALAHHIRLKPARLKAGFAAAVLALLGVLTFGRNEVWATEYTLWNDVVRKSPYSPRAHINLGRLLTMDKRYPEAEKELDLALSLNPEYPQAYVAHYSLGICYQETGMRERATDEFEQAIKRRPDYVGTYERLGELYFDMRRYGDAARVFRQLTVRTKGNPKAHYDLGVSYMMLNRYGDAQEQMEKAMEYWLDNFDVHYNLALIYEKNGVNGKALEQASFAVRLAEDEAQRSDAGSLLSRIDKKVR